MKFIVVDVEQDQGGLGLHRPSLIDGGERHTLGAVEVKPDGVARLDLVRTDGVRYGTILLYERHGCLMIGTRMTGHLVTHDEDA